MQYINIHRHHPPQSNELAIQNLYKDFKQVELNGFYSIGLHPWYITAHWEKEFEQLKHYASHPHVKAIGECGLDKICQTDFQFQQGVFAQQIQLANEINKPLIIHCVKAYDEVLQQLNKAQAPAIFHGFNKSKELALQIIHAGHYLSFGKALQQPHMQEVLKALPPEKIFLETDDRDVSIASIYKLAAKVFSIDELSLSLQLYKNAKHFFPL
ncbi:MAG: TatD family hydrolase [Lacibacter sp.]|jgi:TatD DNase family protein